MPLSVPEQNKIKATIRESKSFLSPTDPEYQSPTGEEIKMILALGDWNYAEAAKLVGVSNGENSRSTTIQKWVSGTRRIPYAAWRLLLLYSRAKDFKANEEDRILGKITDI